MIIVQLTGGLGNQLFQYAAAKSLSLHHNVPLLLDASSFYREKLHDLEVPRNFELSHFKGISEKIVKADELPVLINLKKKAFLTQKLTPAYKKTIYTEPHFHFDKNFFKSKKNVLLKGNWQSEKYFQKFNQKIHDLLQIKGNSIENVDETAKYLKENETVAVHIRRGDYMRKKIILEWHGVMEKDYYKKAFDILGKRINNFKAVYFTDDNEWVKNNLLSVMKGEIVSGNLSKTHIEDLYLMSKCRHNIIANSSFSWWGAWLNDNPDKIVIAPEKWFNKGPRDTQDLIPEGWIKL